MIQLESFSYRYPGSEQPALDGISLQIPQGQFCGVVGPNGAGKSTLCLALSGFVPQFFRGKASGSLHIGGKDAVNTPLGELAGEVGLVFQNPFNQISGARFSVEAEIAFGLENLGLPQAEMRERVKTVMAEFGIENLAERSPFELSGGQQQRVAIASVLAMQPKVLVLDEPTSQLDPHSTEEVFKTLEVISQRGDTTVVLVEHKLEWVATFADRVLVMQAGRVMMDGAPSEILASPELAKIGVGRTKYTEAAARLRTDETKLPVTLEQAQAFLA
jgi:energy-coupling factor transporter ATP-binding protein EcfA2